MAPCEYRTFPTTGINNAPGWYRLGAHSRFELSAPVVSSPMERSMSCTSTLPVRSVALHIRLRPQLMRLSACVISAVLVMLASPNGQPQVATAECLLKNGLGYGPFRDGQGPGAGIYPTVDQIREDLDALRQITRKIRTYSAAGSLGAIPRVARSMGMSVSQGIHLQPALKPDPKRTPEQTSIAEQLRRRQDGDEIAAAVKLAHDGLVDSLIVGNETLTGDQMPKAELVAAIRQVRKEAPGVPITTAEMLDKWQANPDLAAEVDYLLIHFYPFWDKESIQGAADRLLPRLEMLRTTLKKTLPGRDFKFVIGETGWPSAGRHASPKSVPSPENQAKYLDEFSRVACGHDIPFYYFEAFDEEWKWAEGGSGSGSSAGSSTAPGTPQPGDRTFSGRTVGGSWGLIQSDGRLKGHLLSTFKWRGPASRLTRPIFVGPRLSAFYDVGVDSSRHQQQWLEVTGDELKIRYPAGEAWGSVFITVGTPTNRKRSWKDFSDFGVLSLELRGETGNEEVEVGIKHRTDRDDGKEAREKLRIAHTTYRPYTIPLSRFASLRLRVPQDLTEIYVVTEFVFIGSRAQTVYARNIRYERSAGLRQ